VGLFEDLRALLAREVLTPQRVCEILAEHYGGERLYIPRRCEPPPEIGPGDTPQKLMAHGVKRSTAYNWVNRWRR
jgi:hypothetical protein